MAYITKKKIKGITYYYAEQRIWKDGKSQRQWQKYLGTIESIINSIEGKNQTPECAVVFELGCIAAYLDVLTKIDVVKIIDSALPKRDQGASIGEYILLAAINRGVNAVSKRSMWDWFQDSFLLNHMPNIKKDTLSSQRFWDNMNLIPENNISTIWMDIINSTIKNYNIDLSNISYDGTNFYTFISSFNKRCSIAKRGKNKQGRSNLRQINYALFCSKEDHIPLFFDTYDGNTHDSKEFLKIIPKFREAFADKISTNSRMTIIFDKGNNSLNNYQEIDNSNFNFIGSVRLEDHKELVDVPNKSSMFESFEHPKLEQIKAYRLKKIIYNKERTVVLTFNNKLYCDQLSSINNDILKCFENLSDLSQKLNDRVNGLIKKGIKPTIASVKKKVAEILKRQHMKKIISVEYQLIGEIPVIAYTLDADELATLTNTHLGKKIIITDNHDWTTEDIIIAYHNQYVIEDSFKEMKDRKLGCWWPMHHYTDQKIKVHAFYCTLSLLARSIMSREARLSDIKISMKRIHGELSGIKEVLNIYSKEKGKGIKKIKKNFVLTKMDETKRRLFDLFNIKDYTSS